MRWKWNPAYRNPKVQTPVALCLGIFFAFVAVGGLFTPKGATWDGKIALTMFGAFAVLCFWHAWRWRR